MATPHGARQPGLDSAGAAESPGSTGTSGASGLSVSSGPSHATGVSGSSGPSHTSGVSGSSGPSHTSGVSATGPPVTVDASGPPGTADAIDPSGPSVSSSLSVSSSPSTPVNSNATVVDIVNVSNPPAPTLPSNDTDLIFVPGTNRLILSAQQPLIWVVIQDAIENLWAFLLFDHAFPVALQAIKFVRDSILLAAENYKPGTSAIAARLNTNNDYLSLMTRLVNDVHIFYLFSFNMLLMCFIAATSNSADSK